MVGRPTCGNGIVDMGEQCDCGPVSFESLSFLLTCKLKHYEKSFHELK